MSDFIELLNEGDREQVDKASIPDEPSAMLATLTDDHFSDPDWIYERKLDGERVLARRVNGHVTLLSRNGKKLNATYPELVEALEGDGPDFLADGEVVAFEGDLTSFKRLQRRMQIKDAKKARQSNVAVYFYLFDLPYADGFDLAKLPLRRRKSLLKAIVRFDSDRVRYTPHRNEDGVPYWREACKKGWEGVIAKRADSRYVHGRSRDWLKFKCVRQQEFVIGGYTDPKGSRHDFGALLLGYYEDGDLRYAGMVGTGFDDDMLKNLGKRLRERQRETSPFAGDVSDTRKVHWVSPELVGEVGFTEWTDDGKLRHPRFLGLRRDKDPKDVVREAPS